VVKSGSPNPKAALAAGAEKKTEKTITGTGNSKKAKKQLLEPG
jgi:hypothetical protein